MSAHPKHLLRIGAFWLALIACASSFAQEPEGEVPAIETEEPEAGSEGEGEDAGEDEGEGEDGAEGEAPVRPSNAAFMGPLGRLSSILGSVHFLRTLCGDDNAGVWRDKMNELIVAQEPNEADRRILIAQFNSGYRAFESTYRQCTPAADVATRRYLEEGAVLSRDISARYGN